MDFISWIAGGQQGAAPRGASTCPVCGEDTGGGPHRCRTLERRVEVDRQGRPRPPRQHRPPQCSGGHQMGLSHRSDGAYASGFVCNVCGLLQQGARWYCDQCSDDICFVCWPNVEQPPADRDADSGRLRRARADPDPRADPGRGGYAADPPRGAGQLHGEKRRQPPPAPVAHRERPPPAPAAAPLPSPPVRAPAPATAAAGGGGQLWQQQLEHKAREESAQAQEEANRDGGLCPAHQGQRLTLFAMKMRTPLCVKCLHQGRTPSGQPLGDAEWMPYDDAAADVRDYMSRQGLVLRERREALLARSREHSVATQAVAHAVAKAVQDVRAQLREVVNAVAKREEALVCQLEGFLAQAEKDGARRKNAIEDSLQGVEHALVTANDIASGAMPSRDLLMGFESIARTLNAEAAAAVPPPPPSFRCSVTTQPALSGVLDAVSSLGSTTTWLGKDPAAAAPPSAGAHAPPPAPDAPGAKEAPSPPPPESSPPRSPGKAPAAANEWQRHRELERGAPAGASGDEGSAVTLSASASQQAGHDSPPPAQQAAASPKSAEESEGGGVI